MTRRSTPEVFWARVDKTGDCWEWTGTCNNTGYGTLSYQGQPCVAHRVAAFLSGLVATIAAPKSKQDKGHVLHKCDNRKCCNPAHFFLGNYTDNQLDCYAKGRDGKAKGAAHSNARLTNQDVVEIRELYASGFFKQQELATAYEVSQRVISLVVRKEAYL